MKVMMIKLGAPGDVLRTTPILRVLAAETTWVSRRESLPLLRRNRFIHRLVEIEQAASIKDERFDLVLSLDEEDAACRLAMQIKTNRLIGAFLKDGTKTYTESAAAWFDMSLISRFAKEQADDLKRSNRKSYQEIIFALVGEEFNGEEYVFDFPVDKNASPVIGLEGRVGHQWPTKRWDRFDQLAETLTKEGFVVKFLHRQQSILGYAEEINSCAMIISADTLAMHLGMALKKDVFALFGPTSPAEIYDYGRLKKIVAPVDCRCCYRTRCAEKPSCLDLITMPQVSEAIKRSYAVIKKGYHQECLT